MRKRIRSAHGFGLRSVFGAPAASAAGKETDGPLRLLFVCTAAKIGRASCRERV